MPRLHRPSDPAASESDEVAPNLGAAPTPAAAGALGSLADLPVAGLTRRRVAILLAALLAAWVIVLFARQVGEASEATARADAMRASNGQLEVEVSALESELALIQRQAFIAQAARQYRLGKAREIPFALADDAPALPADAPGSGLVRLGSTTRQPSPLDAWARLLLGEPGDAGD
jgi:cell division protein FtsB